MSVQPRDNLILKTEPRRHQRAAYQFALSRFHEIGGVLLGMHMGTGKSKVAVDLAVNVPAQPARVVVLCPVSVLGVWRREFAKHAGIEFYVCVLDQGSGARKLETLNRFLVANASRPSVVVSNYEAVSRCKALGDCLLDRTWDLVILDESHRIKSATSKASRYVARLGHRADFRVCLTGTPMPHSPLDIFGQARFLNPTIFGASWCRFRDAFARRDNPTIPQMVTGYQNLDLLEDKVAKIAFRVGPEVLDLPAAQHEERTTELSPKAWRHYSEIERECITFLERGEITAANAAVKTAKLRQAASGFLIDSCGETHWLDDGKDRILADLVDDLGEEPIVVFCSFREELSRVRRIAEQRNRRYAEISGREKTALTDHAELRPDVDVVGVQYQSGGVGIDLTRAAYAIYYSPTYNLGDYEQSLARLVRPGQTRPVTFYRFTSDGTIDRAVWSALASKANVIEEVLKCLQR